VLSARLQLTRAESDLDILFRFAFIEEIKSPAPRATAGDGGRDL